MRTLLILGGDSIGRSALKDLEPTDELLVVIDKSTSIKRVTRLILKGRLALFVVIKMLFCECKRPVSRVSFSNFPTIKTNTDLLDIIQNYEPERVVLFRAGLVINTKVISKGIPLMNIHCAIVPKYGGLGSIQRAIKDRAISQNATLHRVTETIDDGEVFDLEPYELELNKSYCFNENKAYRAGLRLLSRTIGHLGKDTD